MEQSKLISIVIAKLRVAYPYYFKDLSDEEFVGLISIYQEELADYNEFTLTKAIKSIIRKNKFMPSLNELIEECELSKSYRCNEILKKMRDDGYFNRNSIYQLDDIHANRNYEKALMWIEKGIIPSWLLNDMKKYGYVEDKPTITNTNSNLISIKG